MRRTERTPGRAGERGAALLTVLMLVAVVAVLAGIALEKLKLSTRLAGNAAATEQARGYALAAEALALSRIDALLGQSRERVTLAGGWSGRPFGLPLPGGGYAAVRARDGGNCFNLNGLVAQAGEGTFVAVDDQRVKFARLIRLLGVPPQVGEQVAAGAADWIDTDQVVQPSGAEDAAYLGREPGYRTAGTLMSDPSELRAVAGMTPDLYAKLRPWICTLPVARPSALNVNTLLPEQAPLLAMLFAETLSIDAGRQLLLKRPPQGYGNVGRFWQGAAGVATEAGQAQTTVTTVWFAVAIDVTVGSAQLQENALVDATRLPPRLVSRQWGEPS